MSETQRSDPNFDVLIIAQAGRLQYEAVLFAASFRAAMPNFPGKLIIAEPQPGPKWDNDPRIDDPDARFLLTHEFDAEIRPFASEHFGSAYPYGNKIEALRVLPEGRPFVFFDTDTLILNDLADVPLDFRKPSASQRVTGTWPVVELYGPSHTEIWKSLYDRFGLDFSSSLDLSYPEGHWRRYLYFNAGMFYFSDAKAFGERFTAYASSIYYDRPDALVCQSLSPWLDQVALPLVIHSFGGGRATMPEGYIDGSHSCHYRALPLAYAREADAVIEVLERVSARPKVKKVLKRHEPMKRLIFQGKGQRARGLFDQNNLPKKEQQIRNTLKREKLWLR